MSHFSIEQNRFNSSYDAIEFSGLIFINTNALFTIFNKPLEKKALQCSKKLPMTTGYDNVEFTKLTLYIYLSQSNKFVRRKFHQ
jgi:hypothetical protein